MKLTTIALRNISRNRRRSVLTIAAIAIAAMVIVFMFSIIEGMKYDQRNTVLRFTTGHVRIRNEEFSKNENLYLRIEQYGRVMEVLSGIPEVEQLSPRIQFGGLLRTEVRVNEAGAKVYDKEVNALGMAVDFDREIEFQNIESYLMPDAVLPEAGGILATSGLAEELNVEKGNTVDIFTSSMYMDSLEFANPKVSGIISFPIITLNQRVFLMPLESAQQLLEMGDSVTEILVLFKKDTNLGEKAELVRSKLAEAGIQGLEVKPWTEIGFTQAWLELADMMYNFIALFFFIIGTTVIINTTMMVIYERMKEIGTIAAMGMTGSQIVRLFFLEACFLSIIASFIGVVLGIGLVIPLSITGFDLSQMADVGEMGFDISNIIKPVLNIKSTIFVFFYSVVVASLVSLIPSRRASKIEPVEALRAL